MKNESATHQSSTPSQEGLQPKVSVVIPSYNVSGYLPAALDTVRAQTFSDYEVLVIDDGSTDTTAQVFKEYFQAELSVEEQSSFHLIQQKNRGLAGARNTGIRHAKGLYIALLDADDLWYPNKLETLVNILDHNPQVGVTFGYSTFIDDNDEQLGIEQGGYIDHIDSAKIYFTNPVGNGSSPVIRKKTLEDVQFFKNAEIQFFDESFRQSEDIEMWLRISLKTPWEYRGTSQPLTYYRVNHSGLSANVIKQLDSWDMIAKKHEREFPAFFEQHYATAKAFQYRYLARRAVQSRQGFMAFKMLFKAFKCSRMALIKDWKKTLLTLGCTVLLSILPRHFYESIEAKVMKSQRRRMPQT